MQYLLTAAQAKEADRFSVEERGIPSLVLMERAALSVAEESVRSMERERGSFPLTAFVLCGMGNNGADGLAAARILTQRGFSVSVAAIGSRARASAEWQKQYELVSRLDCPVLFYEKEEDITGFVPASLYIDALFGIGARKEIRGLQAKAIRAFNRCALECGAFRTAVDLPSGVSSDDGSAAEAAVRCDLTVTFGWAKPGHFLYPGASYCGRVHIAEIGFFEEVIQQMNPLKTAELRDLAAFLPVREPDANKGSCGRAAVIAGSPGMAGAAYLCAKAAYRSGAGLVELITYPENVPVLQQLIPEAIISPLPDFTLQKGSLKEWLDARLPRASSIVIGPGLSKRSESDRLVDLVLDYVSETDCCPLVIDADGLNLLAEKHSPPKVPRLVLTPHPGELSRLLGCGTKEVKEDFRGAGRRLCAKYGSVSVCKDARTLVSMPCGEEFLNLTGNDGMAVGGSGDVLAGVIAGLLAQGAGVREAAVLGVWLHGRAGDLAAAETGRRSMVSSEILAHLGGAFEFLEKQEPVAVRKGCQFR